MNEVYLSDQNYNQLNFVQSFLQIGEYENCTFQNCNFEYADLSQFKFTDCEFNGCNLSMAKLAGTAFRGVIFKDCKMFGMHFDDCNEFGLSFSFDGCSLNNSVFIKLRSKEHHLKIVNLLK